MLAVPVLLHLIRSWMLAVPVLLRLIRLLLWGCHRGPDWCGVTGWGPSLPVAVAPWMSQLVLPKGVEREAVSWFSKVYPATQQPTWPVAKPITIIQQPGETVFVPHGWWHAVLNLDLTIAVTHNYVSTSNFPAVWRHARKGRPKMSVKWLGALRQQRPDLAAVADALDEAQAAGQDGGTDSTTSSTSSSSSSSSSSDSSSDDSDDDGHSAPAKRQRADEQQQQQHVGYPSPSRAVAAAAPSSTCCQHLQHQDHLCLHAAGDPLKQRPLCGQQSYLGPSGSSSQHGVQPLPGRQATAENDHTANGTTSTPSQHLQQDSSSGQQCLCQYAEGRGLLLKDPNCQQLQQQQLTQPQQPPRCQAQREPPNGAAQGDALRAGVWHSTSDGHQQPLSLMAL